MNLTNLKIITPNGTFWNKPVTSVQVMTLNGELGLLHGKSPLVAALKIGYMHINSKGGEDHHVCAIAGGIVYAYPSGIEIITDAIEYQEAIDLNRALEAKRLAEARLKVKLDAQEERKVKLTLERAMNRINVKKGSF